MNINSLKIAAAIALVASLMPFGGGSTSAAPRMLIVDDNRVECRNADFTSIQAAVTAAPPGAMIKVCPGTYVEQVNIPAGKDGLTLFSQDNQAAIIKAPPVMTVPKSIVTVSGAHDVTLRHFTISGPYTESGCPAPASVHAGVRILGGGAATLLGNHITQIRDINPALWGCQDGIGVYIGRAFEGQVGTGILRDNLIDTYQKNGVTVDNAGSYAELLHNTIVGSGPTGTIAQNGAQISRGASAVASHNDISGNYYTGGSASSTGVLLFQQGAVTVSHNNVWANNTGIDEEFGQGANISYNDVYANDYGITLIVAEDSTVAHNHVRDNNYDGIGMYYDADNNTVENNIVEDNRGSGIALYDAHGNMVDSNQIRDNGTAGGDTTDGIQVDATSGGNTIQNNHLRDNATHDCHDDSVGPGTAATANFWVQDNGETENRPGLCSR